MSLPKTFPLKAAQGKIIPIPTVGFGTAAGGPSSWAHDAVLAALRAGYRHLDCAWMYGVDAEVGAAIKESGIPRDQIFVTTKWWPHFGRPEDIELCLDKILTAMGLEYVDLYLAHWPFVAKNLGREKLEKGWMGPEASAEDRGQKMTGEGKPEVEWECSPRSIAALAGQKGSFVPTWQAMQALVTKGKTRTIGVSNFGVHELEELLPHSKEIPLSCNQIEVHPWLPQHGLIEYCKKHDILVTCYSPFAGSKPHSSAGGKLLDEPKVVKLAKKTGLEKGQLLQSWAVQRGTVPLGKSATPERIASNLDVRQLDEEVMKEIDAMEMPNGSGRTCDMTEAWGIPLFKQ